LAAIGFTAFGTGHIGDGLLPAGFAGESTSGDDTGFAHQQIYLVAFNASTAAAATQIGVWSVDFTSANPNAAAWRFAASTDFPNTTTIDLEDLTSSPGTGNAPLASGAHIWLGTGTTADVNGNFRLTGIPEPSTYALVATGLVGLLGLRRRAKEGTI